MYKSFIYNKLSCFLCPISVRLFPFVSGYGVGASSLKRTRTESNGNKTETNLILCLLYIMGYSFVSGISAGRSNNELF